MHDGHHITTSSGAYRSNSWSVRLAMPSPAALSRPAACSVGARPERGGLRPILVVLLADGEGGSWRERPGRTGWWPIEIVCPLRDEELEDFGARLRVVVGGGTGFGPIDPAGWA